MGLTKTYNRFHDPYDHAPEIVRLRELHNQMDRAVLAAYGWTDIDTTPDFHLDYEIDEETWGTKKKPYRFRWPNETTTKSLALNKQRHQEEQASRRSPPWSCEEARFDSPLRKKSRNPRTKSRH